MKMITGTKINATTFKMHAPEFPYTTVIFLGYTEREMKQRYRERYSLKGKHIEWIII